MTASGLPARARRPSSVPAPRRRRCSRGRPRRCRTAVWPRGSPPSPQGRPQPGDLRGHSARGKAPSVTVPWNAGRAAMSNSSIVMPPEPVPGPRGRARGGMSRGPDPVAPAATRPSTWTGCGRLGARRRAGRPAAGCARPRPAPPLRRPTGSVLIRAAARTAAPSSTPASTRKPIRKPWVRAAAGGQRAQRAHDCAGSSSWRSWRSVVMAARPTAPPICWLVLIRPEAAPASVARGPGQGGDRIGHEGQPQTEAGQQEAGQQVRHVAAVHRQPRVEQQGDHDEQQADRQHDARADAVDEPLRDDRRRRTVRTSSRHRRRRSSAPSSPAPAACTETAGRTARTARRRSESRRCWPLRACPGSGCAAAAEGDVRAARSRRSRAAGRPRPPAA